MAVRELSSGWGAGWESDWQGCWWGGPKPDPQPGAGRPLLPDLGSGSCVGSGQAGWKAGLGDP